MRRVAGSTIISGVGGRAYPFGRVEIVAFIWIASVIGTIAVSHQQQNRFYTHGRYGKREEPYAQPSAAFFSGSRYGRSDATNSRGSKSDVKILEVSPRVDRFFLGSRYGKRALSDDNNNNNNNNINNLQRLQQRQPFPRISSVKRYEEAIGYFNRPERDDRTVRMIDNSRDRSGSSVNNGNNGDNAEITMEISNQDKLDKFW